MPELKFIPKDELTHESILDEIARQGARRIIAHALDLEVTEYIEAHQNQLDERGHRLVVRNGRAQTRRVATGAGQIDIQAPRVNDRRVGERFTSKILPPYLRKSPNVESLVPILYLRGLSTNDFETALESILGKGVAGLSPSSIVSLKRSWERELNEWSQRKIEERFVYLWADGVNVKVRLGEDKRICLLVIVGVTESGEKKLLAVQSGYRESKESWKIVLQSLVDRGLQAPLLAIADGALGFWAAIQEIEVFKNTKHSRCWVHKIANVLDCFPKRLQPQAKSMLHEMMYAATQQDANQTKKRFDNLFHEKFPKATQKLGKDWDQLRTHFSFPASHWNHIRSTNVIESTFATVKLRTKVTKGAGSPGTAAAMAFKLLQQAEQHWRKINKPSEIKNLLNGLEYRDGVVITTQSTQESVA